MRPPGALSAAVGAPARLAVPLLLGAGALGLCAGTLGIAVAASLLAGLGVLAAVLRDYRAGVLVLTLLLPVAPMLPALKGLNPLNIALALTLASFWLRPDALARRARVRLPGALWLGLVLPATWGMLVAWPQVPHAAHHYPDLPDAAALYEPWAYATARYAKPLAYYLGYVWLLAHAVRDTPRPERFAAVLCAAMVAPALAVFYTVGTYPGTLVDVSRDREFMAARGLHANEFGMMLAAASGPLLFMAPAARAGWPRWVLRATFVLCTAALLLTFSRGGLLAWLVVVGGHVWRHRRLRTLAAAGAVFALVLALAPASMTERFSTGLREGSIGQVTDVEKDDLTAGRVHGWLLLAPEVRAHPWFGGGLGSTQWSQAVATGRYKANHPHNIYLEILMDLGLAGLAAMAWLQSWLWRRYAGIGSQAALPAVGRAFFDGARWSMLGVWAMAATTAYYMPNAAQFPLWFCLGVALAVPPAVANAQRPVARPTQHEAVHSELREPP